MKAIYKYTIEGTTRLLLPIGAQVLTVQEQRGDAQMWVLLDPHEKQTEQRTFVAYPTGATMPDEVGNYIGTFQLSGGSLVFHLFEEKD